MHYMYDMICLLKVNKHGGHHNLGSFPPQGECGLEMYGNWYALLKTFTDELQCPRGGFIRVDTLILDGLGIQVLGSLVSFCTRVCTRVKPPLKHPHIVNCRYFGDPKLPGNVTMSCAGPILASDWLASGSDNNS